MKYILWFWEEWLSDAIVCCGASIGFLATIILIAGLPALFLALFLN
jgi:hypothetical protein